MRDLRADFSAELREFNGGAEHVHLANVLLTVTISQLVNSPKGASSRRLRQEFPDPRRHYCRAKCSGPGSHFTGSAGGRPDHCPAPVHRTAEPSRPTGSRPAAFITGLTAGALAAILVAARRGPGQHDGQGHTTASMVQVEVLTVRNDERARSAKPGWL